MPLTIEQLAARKQAIEDNKQSLGLKKAGIDSNAAVTDVRSLYGSEPAAPGTQNPVTPAVPGAPPAATTSPTIAEAAANIDVPDFNDPYQQFGDFYKSQFDTPVDEKAIRASTRERFQSEIDAINQIYAQKLAESKVQGQGRLGSSRSIQARSGLLGSDFGAAQTDTVGRYNTEIDNSVLAEQNAKVQAILTKADTDASDEIAAKRLAKQQGADAYLAFLQGQQERKAAKVTGIVQTLFDKGIDPTRLDKATLERITASYGTDLGTLSAGYKALQQAQDDAEQAALDKEIGRTKSLAEIDKLTTETDVSSRKADSDIAKSRADAVLSLANAKLKQLEADNFGQPPIPGTKDYAEYQKILAETAKVIKEMNTPDSPKLVKVDGVDYTYDGNGQLVRPTIPTGPSADKVQKAQDMVTRIDQLLSNGALGSAVGPLSSKTFTFRDGTADFETQFKNLQALMTIDNLALLKGPMSDKDIQFLKESASALNLGMSEAGFRTELERIKTKLQGVAQSAGTGQRDRLEVGGVIYEDDGTGNYVPLPNEGSDSNAQAVIGKAQPSPITLAVAKKYPVGSTGGQCTTFLHKIADFPPIGDGKNQKFASVDKIGIPKAQWQPRVGDIIVTDDNETYGHTMILTLILPGNKGQVTESNWKGNEKVTHSRIVNLGGSNIYGAIRPKQLKTTLV